MGEPQSSGRVSRQEIRFAAKNLFGLRCCEAWPGFRENTLGELAECYMQMVFGGVVIGSWFLSGYTHGKPSSDVGTMTSERVKRI